MTKSTIAITVLLSAITAQANAQGLGIELDGGLQGTHYQLQNGQTQLQPGGSLGLLYTFRLGDQWGLITGIKAGLYRTQATFPDGTTFSNYQVDDEGSAFQYGMKTTGYKETQQFFAAGIPLLLQFHTTGPGTQWYINGGGKILFPSSVTSTITAQQLTLSGYYPDVNITVTNLPQHGFGTINNWSATATTELKPATELSAATGASFRLSAHSRLYAGLYVEYGLTDLKNKTDSLPLATYSPTGVNGTKAGGVLNMPLTGKMTSLSFGLQIRLSFETAKAKGKPRPVPVTKKVPQIPVDSTLSDEEAKIILKPVIFGIIQEVAVPGPEQLHLNDVAAILLEHPKIRISIVGHICNSLTETEDPKVGAARAEAVAEYLRGRGVPRTRMDVSSLDQSDPVLPNNPAANFQKRRVVITAK